MKTYRTQIKGNDVEVYRQGERLELSEVEVRIFRLHEQVMQMIREETSEINYTNPYTDTVGNICFWVDRAEHLAMMLNAVIEGYRPGSLEHKTIRGALVAMMNVPKRMDKWLTEHPEVVSKEVKTIA